MEKQSFVDDLSMKHGYVKDYMRLHSSCLISHWFTLHHMALYNPRTSHRGFWLAKLTMGDFPDLEYQRVAVFRSFLLGSAVPVFTQRICHQSFSEVTSSEKKYISPFFHLSNVTTYHRGYITSSFHFNKKWRYLHHSFTISFFRGFGSDPSHFYITAILFSTWDDRWNISTGNLT